jgi:hypothetical protein
MSHRKLSQIDFDYVFGKYQPILIVLTSSIGSQREIIM